MDSRVSEVCCRFVDDCRIKCGYDIIMCIWMNVEVFSCSFHFSPFITCSLLALRAWRFVLERMELTRVVHSFEVRVESIPGINWEK